MDRHACAPADPLVGGGLDCHVEGPVLAAAGLGQLCRKFNRQTSFAVSDSFALLHQPAGEATKRIAVLVVQFHRLKTVEAARGRIGPEVGIGFGQQPPGDRRIGQGTAAEVTGFHCDLHSLTLDVFGLGAVDADLEFGSPVFGYLEIRAAVGRTVAGKGVVLSLSKGDAHFHAVVAGSRGVGQGQLAVDSAVLVDGEFPIHQHIAPVVPDCHPDGHSHRR